ncbi:camphor resistance protein CrcB [Mesonia phycicola]|uniref:Fluoride-specific ion channel FluC n=1 Tax=Mesonia phycicola TaxID=579105 RepID=A0A1M6GN78_9FLAO|nr:fluoride efflux transporter CrcB [Mesonia phycicola]SHJ11444.1 camphor resistance protein CrcB [Mesonia phycicola]
MKNLILVFIGGGTGSIIRFLLGKWLNNQNTGIPYGTFAANVIGSFLIGIILGYLTKNESISQGTMLLLATGFCGGFTTFSTFAYESHVFLKSGDFISFATYTIGSIVLGFSAVFLGMWLIKFT